MGGRIKVTSSLREDLVKKVKSKLAMEGKGLSKLVEELLSTYDQLEVLDGFCQELGLEKSFFTSFEVKARRLTGFKAEEIVREAGDELSDRLFRY
jgi:hypothetical protein